MTPQHDEAENYPLLLEDLRSFLVTELQKMGINGDCEHIALAVTEHIRTFWGGEQLYLPKGRFQEINNRDRAIEAEFNGANARELRKRHGITERHFYRIVNRVRAERREKLKGSPENTLNTGERK